MLHINYFKFGLKEDIKEVLITKPLNIGSKTINFSEGKKITSDQDLGIIKPHKKPSKKRKILKNFKRTEFK